jgi:glyoxylase-like metal-dependent hydrolase (beta-lactamase superfamily II)
MPRLREIAPGLHQLPLDPIQGVNCYVAGDVLIDAGGRLDAKRILKALDGRAITAHALTHVHPDHQGSSHAVCEALGIPFWVPAGEHGPAETGDCLATMPGNRIARFSNRVFAGPGHPVERDLAAGDEVGGFIAVSLPGHSPDQLGYWRESDRVLVCGDALRNMSYATGRPGLRLPPDFFSVDMDRVRASARAVAELEPELLAFGHGRPMRGGAAIARAIGALL